MILPLIVEQFLAVTIGMADTIMVASTGEAAMSSVSLVDAINILLINIFSALATGGAIVASQYLGRRTTSGQRRRQAAAVGDHGYVGVYYGCLPHRTKPHPRPDFRENRAGGDGQLPGVFFLGSALSYPFLAVYNAGAALYRSMAIPRSPCSPPP